MKNFDYDVSEEKIIGLFPTPLYHRNLEGELDLNELREIIDTKWSGIKMIENEFNKISYDPYVLSGLEDTVLYNTIYKHMDYFFHEIMGCHDEAELYITESWLILSNPKDKHGGHYHPNSYVSAVLYLDVAEDTGTINFHSMRTEQLRIDRKLQNQWNYVDLNLTPKPLDLLIFPSTVQHSVSENLSQQDRIALGVNSFVRGKFTNKKLMQLNI